MAVTSALSAHPSPSASSASAAPSATPGPAVGEAVEARDGAGQGPGGNAGRDPHPLRAALLVGLAVSAGVFAWSLWWGPLVDHAPVWLIGSDTWMAPTAAIYVAHGAYQEVYLGASGYFALPLSAILLAPVVRLGEALHLVNGYPYVLPKPSMWLVVGPFTLIAGSVPLLYAARALAWEAGVRRRLWLLQAGSALAVSIPCAVWGHFEDSLATALVLLAIRARLRERHLAAAVLVGLAICSKQWALLAVPMLLLAGTPRRRWVPLLAVAAALPLLLVVEPLLAFPHQTLRALVFEPTPDLALVHQGHESLLAGLGTAADRIGRIGAVLASVVLAWWIARRHPHLWPFGIAAALVVRPLAEPYLLGYYLSPGMLVLALAVTMRRRRVEWWVLAVCASPVIWAVPDARGSDLTWWAGELILLGVAGFACARVMLEPAAGIGPAGPAPSSIAGCSASSLPASPTARPWWWWSRDCLPASRSPRSPSAPSSPAGASATGGDRGCASRPTASASSAGSATA